jgi:hypothetical protein
MNALQFQMTAPLCMGVLKRPDWLVFETPIETMRNVSGQVSTALILKISALGRYSYVCHMSHSISIGLVPKEH